MTQTRKTNTQPNRYYFFECIELIRKFLLCGCLQFVAPGTSSQILVGFTFCAFYLALVAYLAPYESESDDLFSTVCPKRPRSFIHVQHTRF